MPGRFLRRNNWIAAGLVIITLAVVVPPFVNVNRYRNQIATAIGNALGRNVTVSSVELKLIPRPGLVLSGFVVSDDPSFGPEPMMRAETVTAYLRVSSLWRGRLEVGTLELENPSLNLVRRADGRWNLLDLVERSSQVSPAPTATSKPQQNPRFPYVQATAGRINFKLGQVKKAFAFADADFAIWLESPHEWGIRLEARPMRADVPLGDTGVLRVEGRFQQADSFSKTPVTLKLDYSKAQLGQVTSLVYGRDRGWRGTVTATGALAGTPSSLAVTLDSQIEDFRRYDIALGEALRLSAHCTGTLSDQDDSLRAIQCQAPIRPGQLTLRGDIVGSAAQALDLGLTAEKIPLARLVALARHTKKDLPEDLTSTGSLDAVFTLHRSAGAPIQWTGGGQTTRFSLQSKVLKPPLELGPLEFGTNESTLVPGGKRGQRSAAKTKPALTESSLRVLVKSFAMPLGAASPASASALFDLASYRIVVSGSAELSRLLDVAKAMGIAAPAIDLTGPVQLDAEIAGGWTGFVPPMPSGRMLIHDAKVQLPGVFEPLHISQASMLLGDQSISLTSFAAEFNSGPSLSGSASFPLHCSTPPNCMLHFDLRTPETSLARINQLLNPAAQNRPWYRRLELGQESQNLPSRLRAQGRLSVGQFSITNLVATNLTGNLQIDASTARLSDLKADLLGGHHEGNWDADFTASPPKFYGSGVVNKIVMAQVATLMHDPWATGTLAGQYTIGLVGLGKDQLLDSATGSVDFKWMGGSIRHITLENKPTPLSFTSFKGDVAVRNRSITCQLCVLRIPGADYNVTGNVGLDRSLDLRLERSGSPEYAISGPLDKPTVKNLAAPPVEATRR
jgi:uncharacterized protein involved in outer membrane biogenesis